MVNSQWAKPQKRIPCGTPVHVLLDMDAHTLSFAIDDGAPQLAYTNLPDSVRPYVCSGEKKDRSLLIASDAASKPRG